MEGVRRPGGLVAGDRGTQVVVVPKVAAPEGIGEDNAVPNIAGEASDAPTSQRQLP